MPAEREVQLELKAQRGDTPPLSFPIIVPEHFLKVLGRLEPSAMHELGLRAHEALAGVLARIREVRALPDEDLFVMRDTARRDLERFDAELHRRAEGRRTCDACGGRDVHMPGCRHAAAARR